MVLENKLKGMGAVLVEGAKWCGKTTTGEQHAASVLYMDNPKDRTSNIQMVKINPDFLLNGATPRLIDEWQIAPELWDAVRFAVDHRDEDGQFILTGSVTPLSDEDDEKIHHSGVGRIARLRMRPMTLWESGDSTGEISLGVLFQGAEDVFGSCDKDLYDIAWLMCRGGWPRAVNQSKDIALGRAFDYYDTVVNVDIIGILAMDAPEISAKNGINIQAVLDDIVSNVPAPAGDPDAPLKALIFDSQYDSYRGVIVFMRLIDGRIAKGTEVLLKSTGAKYSVLEVGHMRPIGLEPCSELCAGETEILPCVAAM